MDGCQNLSASSRRHNTTQLYFLFIFFSTLKKFSSSSYARKMDATLWAEPLFFRAQLVFFFVVKQKKTSEPDWREFEKKKKRKCSVVTSLLVLAISRSWSEERKTWWKCSFRLFLPGSAFPSTRPPAFWLMQKPPRCAFPLIYYDATAATTATTTKEAKNSFPASEKLFAEAPGC